MVAHPMLGSPDENSPYTWALLHTPWASGIEPAMSHGSHLASGDAGSGDSLPVQPEVGTGLGYWHLRPEIPHAGVTAQGPKGACVRLQK